MLLHVLTQEFSVCKLRDITSVDFTGFVFLAITDDEISLVCETSRVPPDAVAAEHGWRTLKVDGVLDFGMVGVIAGIAGVLARGGVSVFVVSTYNTDYVLVKAVDVERAAGLLGDEGYEVVWG